MTRLPSLFNWIFIVWMIPCLGRYWAKSSESSDETSEAPGASGIPAELHGYVEVRPGAHLFYWFIAATDSDAATLPLVLWHNGGPGSSSSGLGNFGEIGPRDPWLKPREYAWNKKVNLLFIDSPVATGWSYVDDESFLTSSIEDISDDLLQCHKDLMQSYPFMQTMPFWLFGESYGGKIVAHFGNRLNTAIKNAELSMDFQGIASLGGWIAPVEYFAESGSYLKAYQVIDNKHYDAMTAKVPECRRLIDDEEDYAAAYNAGCYIPSGIPLPANGSANGAWVYNVACWNKLKACEWVNSKQIQSVMNDEIKQEINVDAQEVIPFDKEFTQVNYNDVFKLHLMVDFLADAIEDVDALLADGLKVNIWNGQYDFLVNTPGQLAWIKRLEWASKDAFIQQDKQGVVSVDATEMGYYKKSYENLAFYFHMEAGHMAPFDKPADSMQVLCDIVGLECPELFHDAPVGGTVDELLDMAEFFPLP